MEEEKDDKLQRMGDVNSVTSIGNSWIICRSQTHSGRIYYFNTLTGKAVWNLSDAEMKKAQLHSMSVGEMGDTNLRNCPEPTEPPVDIPTICTSRPPPRGPRIYNKQVINNQFTKPYVSPFVSPQCHCSSVKHICDGRMSVVPTPVFTPNMWTVPPPHPLFLTPAMPLPNNHFHNLNLHQSPQNVGLSTGFQVTNNCANKTPFHQQYVHKDAPKYQNSNSRMNRTFSRDFENKPSQDLRNILSARRRLIKDANCDARQQETSNDHDKGQDVASIVENDLYPSDIDDEWLEAYAGDDKIKLNINVSVLWRLASGTENKERWFIVASAAVLLNHLKLLTSIANSDEKLHVVVPMEVRRRLRRGTGAAGAAGRRAQRANNWAARQANKVPAELNSCKDGSIVSCCLDLLQRNYYVIHLTDDSDFKRNQNEIHKLGESAPVFTVNELKEFLVQNIAPAAAPANITVTVFPDDEIKESIPEKSPKVEDANITNTEPVETPSKTKEIERVNTPTKRTANASVQTDFSALTSYSSSLNSTTEVIEIDRTFKINLLLGSDSSKEETTSAKKIKLNRSQSVKKDGGNDKKPSFKWRKRRAQTLNENESNKIENVPLLSTIETQPNDNAVDYGSNIEVPKELSQEEKDIVMFEVTSDQMVDYLSKGSDEWLSRFVQIMEEALTQILHQEPCFVDPSMPPPWSIQEATVCIKQKFKHNSNIVFACYTLNAVLEEISDNRGKIYSNLNPARFMQMYSYGVNLIEALQSELRDNEDVQIALESLSKLLFDIRNPNVEGTQVFPDSFVYEDATPSANDTESEKYDGPNDFPTSPEKTKESPPKKIVQEPAEEKPSPRKYNLRSAEKKKPECVNTVNESFFTGLGLKKNVFVDGPAIKVSFDNSQTPLLDECESEKREQPITQPKITRNFAKCPEYEERLKQQFCYVPDEFAEDNNCSGNGFYLEEEYGCGNEAEIKRSPSSGEFDTSAVLDWFVERTVCPVNKVLKQIHKFCLDANEDLKNKDSMEQERKVNLFEKTAMLNVHLGGLCKKLNSILQRKDTRNKFREMMKVLEINDFVLSDSQASNYKTIIEKFLEQAGILLDSVNLIATEVKAS